MQPLFSIIVPAYNEEAFLPATLAAIYDAARRLGEPIEVIVADNLSTDRTREVAKAHGARVIPVPVKCISAVRNRAAEDATGKYLVFQDADNRMSADLLIEIKQVLDTGRYVGGGIVNARYDRDSIGLRMTHGLVKLGLALSGVAMFLFYTTPEHFRAVGGFDERLLSTEDHDFARRLRRYGKESGLRYMNLRKGELLLSSRKFDEYGDWAVLRRPVIFLKACFNNPSAAHELWYKPRRERAADTKG